MSRILKIKLTWWLVPALLWAFSPAVSAEPPAGMDSAEYKDVPRNHWAYQAIARLSHAGLIEGLAEGTFAGNRALTRYEAAVMLARLNSRGGYGPVAGDLIYPDVPRGHWASAAVNELDRLGLMEGLPDGTFAGDQPVTRYTGAVLLARLLYPATNPGEEMDFHEGLRQEMRRRYSQSGVTTFFPDIPAEHWAGDAANWLAVPGLAEGFADGQYHGSRPLTRYEWAVTLARVFN